MVGMTCVGFSKNVSISVTEFVMASIVDTKGVLVDCDFFGPFMPIALPLSLVYKTFYVK